MTDGDVHSSKRSPFGKSEMTLRLALAGGPKWPAMEMEEPFIEDNHSGDERGVGINKSKPKEDLDAPRSRSKT